MDSKLDRLRNVILPMLKCIHCAGVDLQLSSDESMGCAGCGASYRVHDGIPLMLKDPEGALEFSEDVTAGNRYSGQWLDIIKEAGAGFVLDFGSGNNADCFDNVVKMDVFAFPFVDVVGEGEMLPFRDGCFDAVISGAVFEHVQDPFLCAENLHKATRSGARIYIETAFLQPYHAYPHHYFNMTTRGVSKVFEAFQMEEVGVRAWQGPLFTLSWILRRWAEILPEGEREKFLSASVKEILDDFNENPFSLRWLSSFGDRDNEELASGVYFYGRKS